MLNVSKGDIIEVLEPTFIIFNGGKWQDHFSDKKHFYKVMENPTNAGNFTAKDSKGVTKLFNVKDISKIK